MSDIILWQIFWFFYGIVITQLWHSRSYIVCTFGKCSDFRCYLHLSSGFVKILNLKFIISILSLKSFLTYTNNKATCFLSYFLVYPVQDLFVFLSKTSGKFVCCFTLCEKFIKCANSRKGPPIVTFYTYTMVQY